MQFNISQNQQIKSKNVCLLYKINYLSKLNNLLKNDSDFSKIKNFNLFKPWTTLNSYLKTQSILVKVIGQNCQ